MEFGVKKTGSEITKHWTQIINGRSVARSMWGGQQAERLIWRRSPQRVQGSVAIHESRSYVL